jgi:Fe-S oxidoreductase
MFLALGLIALLGYTKLLHIITSGANQYFRSFAPKGELKPIPDIENTETFGVGKIEEFTWKQLLDGEACTRCGRCQERCPAYLSEKPLNPKKLTLDLKEHLYEMKPYLLSNSKSEKERKPLIGGAILEDEIWSCTTCRACMEECPVFIEHIDKIVEMRRNLVLMQSIFPNEVKLVFKNMETNYNPWGIGFSQRADWAKEQNVKIRAEEKGEYLFWVGCSGSFDDRNKKVSKAIVKILQAAKVDFAILGEEETCCGDSARRIGNEYLAQILMQGNIEIFKNYEVKKIITMCPHCYNTFKNEYHQFNGNYEVYHHTEFIFNLIKTGKLSLKNGQSLNLTYHDSCYLGRYNNIYSEPREVLKSLGKIEFKELDWKKERSFCCGAGGGRMWMEESLGKRINQMRVEQIVEKNVNTVATACPYCLTMLEDGVKEKGQTEKISVFDLAELVEKSL